MAYQVTPAAPILAFIFLLTLSLTVYGLFQYHRRGHQSDLLAFISLLLSMTVWTLTSFYISIVTSPGSKLFGFNFINTVIAWLFVYSLLWFALAYSDTTQWINRRIVSIAVATILVTSTAAVLAPEYLYEVNGLITQDSVTILGITFEQWVALDRDLKLPFFFSQLYGYVVMLIAGGVLGRYLVRNRGDLYTGQAAALAVGIGTPLVVNVLLFAGLVPPDLNATTVSFGVTAIAFAIAIFRYRLLRVAPVGRQQLVDTMDDPVVMLDDEGRVVDTNPAARDLVDAPVGWRGMAAEEFFAPFPEQYEQFAGDTSVENEIDITVDDTIRYFDLDISPIEDESNTATGQLVVLRDITEQKEREQELRETKQKLEQFAGVVSHDLRNPLNAAQLRLDLLRREKADAHINEVEMSLNRMQSIIEDLLTLSRAGATVEDPQQVSLAALVNESWETAKTDDAELEVLLDESTTVWADQGRLRHVFENLFRNAVDHNSHPLTVRVGLLDVPETTADDDHPEGFFVEDDGDGIPDDEQDEIFGHGYTTSDEGTGFGLSIVEDVVEAHNWTISITESQEGGARFEIAGVEVGDHSSNSWY